VRIAIAGVYLEASTFCVRPAGRRQFVEMRGQELLDSYEWLERLGDVVADVEWVPTLRAMGNTAAGPCEPELFDGYVAEIIDALRADLAANGPLDGLYLDMHGAMNVLGRRDAEETFLRAVREVVGDGPVISLSMDPHGNFSRELAELVDLAACHRHSPHIDTWQTRERAVTNLIETIRVGHRPLRAWVRVPVLLPGERTSTVVEPAKTVFGGLDGAIERHGVLDANLWVGFAWADEPRNAAGVLVTGHDVAAVSACAREVAGWYWDAREDFDIVVDHVGTWDEALDFVLAAQTGPVFVSDSGDNQTAGGTGDVTFALSRTLERQDVLASGKQLLFGGIVDEAAVDAAAAAGIGATLDITVGGYADRRYGQPVAGPWQVVDLIVGLLEGEGIQGAVLTDGRVHVTVQRLTVVFAPGDDVAWAKRRKPGLAWWRRATEFDAVVVKNGYLFPGQAALAADVFMALTPGATDLDMDRLEFVDVARPLFPFDRAFEADLTPLVLTPRS
jgi:microcystin degradation protein MlrC